MQRACNECRHDVAGFAYLLEQGSGDCRWGRKLEQLRTDGGEEAESGSVAWPGPRWLAEREILRFRDTARLDNLDAVICHVRTCDISLQAQHIEWLGAGE